MNKPRLVISLLILALLTVPSQAFSTQTAFAPVPLRPTSNVVQAASCAQQDVQAAIDAASDGDFVLIPAGHCTWNVLATQTPSVIIDNKAITLQGAGIERTVITDGTSLNWNEVPLRVNSVLGKRVRVTGFTIVGQGTGHYDSFAAITLYGSSQNFRVDHIRFDNIAGRSISVSGKTYGVIDHCEFLQPNGQGVLVTDDRGTPPGSMAWEEPMSFGTADAVFIEDSLFQWGSGADGAIDCGNGGRYVFRHNTVEGIMVGNHGLDTKPRSCMQMEIYDNTFLPSSHAVYVAVQSRGGTALIFNNAITGSYQLGIGVTNYRSCCYAGAACTPSPDPPLGTCDGTNPLDGNTLPLATFKGWPCKDQIGRGTHQSSEPLFEWNNSKNGADVDVTVYNNWTGCLNPQPSDHVKENRDYYNDTPKPGYMPYVYPHPLAKDIVLSGAPADRTIHLNWEVNSFLPVTSTWHIAYYSQTVSTPITINDIVSPTRAYTLSDLTNYAWYTVTLNAMLDTAPLYTDTIKLMPTDRLVYLPIVRR
jgi:hypothetical protein